MENTNDGRNGGRPLPKVSDLETIQSRSDYQAMDKVQRPPYWGVDLDPARRPGVPMMRTEPAPLPNAKVPPDRQSGTPSSPMHGRSNKTMPPVFGTAMPLRGLSGMLRRRAYRLPDHYPSHWMMKLFADRVDSWEHRVKKYLPVVAPVLAAAVLFQLAPSWTSGRRRRKLVWR